MLFQDRATIEGKARITRDGYLVADALVAQADNVQDYLPAEICQPPKADGSPYRIGRPASEVFNDATLASAAHRPITIGHPGEDVTAENWKRYAVGDIGDEIAQQGKFVRVPIKMMDSAAIKAAQTTHQQFSLGYSADIDMTPTKIGDQQVDGVVRNIRINHLALVPAARGGPKLRIVDERTITQENPMKIKIGDAEVDATNGEAVSIAVKALDAKLTDAEKQVGTLTADLTTAKTAIEARDGKIAALETQLADAKVTPAKLADMVAQRAKVLDAAKAMGAEPDGDEDEVMLKKMAVKKKMGAAADKLTDAQIDGAFAAFAASIGDGKTDPFRRAVTDASVNFDDGAWSPKVFKAAGVSMRKEA